MRWLSSALGPGVRADGPGSCSPATEESVGPPTAAGLARCLAYHGCPAGPLAAGNKKVALPSTHSCSTALGCEGSGLAAGWSMQSLKADDAWWRVKSLKGLSRHPRNDQPWLPSMP